MATAVKWQTSSIDQYADADKFLKRFDKIASKKDGNFTITPQVSGICAKFLDKGVTRLTFSYKVNVEFRSSKRVAHFVFAPSTKVEVTQRGESEGKDNGQFRDRDFVAAQCKAEARNRFFGKLSSDHSLSKALSSLYSMPRSEPNEDKMLAAAATLDPKLKRMIVVLHAKE